MSWSALDWASKQNTGNGTNKLVLICLANYADDTNVCFPNYKTLIKITELSRSTIIRSLKQLQEKGFIEIEERFDDFYNSKRQTSNLYKLKVGYQFDTHEYQNDKHPTITPTPHITNHNKPIYCEDFNKMWQTYPRKDGSKKKAFDIWKKLTNKPNLIIIKNDLYNHVEKYSKINKGKDIKFIPHLTTWLNQRRWETIEETKDKINLNQLVG
jgi:hypothetical protein